MCVEKTGKLLRTLSDASYPYMYTPAWKPGFTPGFAGSKGEHKGVASRERPQRNRAAGAHSAH